MKNPTRIKYKDMGTCLWCPKPRYEFNGHTYALCEKHRSDAQSTQRKRIIDQRKVYVLDVRNQ